MDKWKEIKSWIAVLGFLVALGTLGYNSCATRRDIEGVNRRLNEAREERKEMRTEAREERKEMRTEARIRYDRIEDKLEKINQNHIDHLTQQHKGD